MKTRTMPAPRRAGTPKQVTDRILAKTGQDPETLLLLIRLCDRIVANRSKRSQGKSTRPR